MHESRLVADLIAETVRIAELNDATHVREVTLSIGALSHVTAASLESHLREGIEGSVAEGATFTITKSSDTSAADALDVRLVSMAVGEA